MKLKKKVFLRETWILQKILVYSVVNSEEIQNFKLWIGVCMYLYNINNKLLKLIMKQNNYIVNDMYSEKVKQPLYDFQKFHF